MSTTTRLLGIVMSLVYFAILVHESATGAEYIRGIAAKLVMTHGLAPFAAHNFAAAIVLVAPLIALVGLVGFAKKR